MFTLWETQSNMLTRWGYSLMFQIFQVTVSLYRSGIRWLTNTGGKSIGFLFRTNTKFATIAVVDIQNFNVQQWMKMIAKTTTGM